MNIEEKRQLYKRAQEKDPHRVQIMDDLYLGTDMTAREYWEHLKIIAEEEE